VIHEAAAALCPLGVGINVQPHVVRGLFALGLPDDLDAIGLRTAEAVYAARNGKVVWSEPCGFGADYAWP
jgi:hypothetical protein